MHAPCVVCFWVSGTDQNKTEIMSHFAVKIWVRTVLFGSAGSKQTRAFFTVLILKYTKTFHNRLFIFWSVSSREDARSWAKGGNTLWGTMHYGKLVRDVCRHVRWVDNSDRSKLTLMQIYTPKKYSSSIEVCSHNHPHHHHTSKSV